MEENKDKKQQEIVEYINDFPTEEEEKAALLEKNLAEQNFQRAQKRLALRKKIIKTLVFALIFAAIAGAIFLIIKNNSAPAPAPKKILDVKLPENKDHVFANDVSGVENGDESIEIDSSKGLMGKSENYQIKDIAIGGGSVVLAAETEILPLGIYDVRSDTLFSRDQKETKLLISWKTNKLAKSEVQYAKSGSDKKALKENSFGFSHALVLGKLDPATRYSFVIDAADRGGTRAKSDEFVVYTGSKIVSVFELISGEMDEIFGWAIKK